jgi:ribosomal protein S18 acetylase RimI-like enzyme
MAPTEPLVVRALAVTDLPAYKALREEMLARHEEAFTSDAAAEAQRTVDSYRGRLGGAAAPASFTLGALRGERLVGAITCEQDGRSKVRHLGHIVGMMVHTDVQAQGVGSALLEAALARARSDGLEQITLSVTSSNEAALRLYRRFGFAPYGRLPRALKLGNQYFDKDLLLLAL